MDLLTGLDDIDWSALEHAYGPAHEVPDLLRGLVSDDPEVRETALDGMYAAVHHQESIYDSTLAAIPFLIRIAGQGGLPGRSDVLELLASIGDPEGDFEPGTPERQATDAVAEAFPLFLAALDDPDPDVRQAACEALTVCRAETAEVVGALVDRLRIETDAGARSAIVTALGTFGARAGAELPSLPVRLAEVADDHTDPALRITALTELAGFAPDALPDDVVAVASGLIAEVYAAGTPTVEPAGFSTPTLLGALREQTEQSAVGRRAPDAFLLVAGLSRALGDRVEDRTALLVPLLESADWEQRIDAVHAASALIQGRRGDHERLVRLIGAQLHAPEPRVPGAAASALQHLGEVAAPAADALAASVAAAPREAPHSDETGPPAWLTLWPQGLPGTGPTLHALAALRDPRAVEPVRWALERPEPPSDIGHVVCALGPPAADFVPLIRARLRDLPVTEGFDSRRSGLVRALGPLGAAEAVPDIVEFLPETSALESLGALGPRAAEAVPALRGLLDDPNTSVAVAAATALWRVDGDADRVRSTLARHLDNVHAVAALGELGEAAEPHLPALRALLTKPDDYGWTRLHVAEALWRLTGDADTVLPLLTAVWTVNAHTRRAAVRCMADMGPAAAPAAPLLREELARPRRHTAKDDGWSSDQVRADEELLRLCRGALVALGVE
ncbi:HEAT repeat domain-containing protein [Saccharothrix sp. NRRL B-16314]|uniref:HEAT repeat domain-containing protein n=1 Tax=Saccharothrix sp. NRRL B-16314 TaxID=1463825 RepID=UPI00052755CC|nr:HEAT repeat domain-containing protein [Saccharothrix sp. NRRL B-16314]